MEGRGIGKAVWRFGLKNHQMVCRLTDERTKEKVLFRVVCYCFSKGSEETNSRQEYYGGKGQEAGIN